MAVDPQKCPTCGQPARLVSITARYDPNDTAKHWPIGKTLTYECDCGTSFEVNKSLPKKSRQP